MSRRAKAAAAGILGMAVLGNIGRRQADAQSGSAMVSSGSLANNATPSGSAWVRTIDDPSNGDRWLLDRGDSRSGGPGRLVRIAGGAGESSPQGSAAQRKAPAPVWVIRAGDRLVVEERTAVVDARLEAVALASTPNGGVLPVRLALGGRVFEAVALGPGQAALVEEARR